MLRGERQLQPQELTPEQQRTDLIGAYLEKFGSISGKAITPQLIAIYCEALSDLEMRRLEAGLAECLRTTDRFPWPSQIIEASDLG